MKNTPVIIRIALIFILINALIFFVLGVLIATGVHTGLPEDATVKMLMMLGMFSGAIILGLLYLLLKRRRLAFFTTLVVLAVIIMLTIFDQVGWADLVMLLLVFVPFVLLILGRRWFLQPKPK